MAKPATTRKLGRNDPCHCGSGRKYKDCHLREEEAQRSEQLKLRRAQDSLLPKIVEAAQSVPEQLPAAFERFWGGRYTAAQMDEIDALEDRGAERFLIWFAFDHRQPDGRTLVGQLHEAAGSGGFDANPVEQQLLAEWQSVRLRPYLVAELHKGKGILARDLLTGREYEVADSHAAKRLEPGEVLVAHIVPVDTPPGASGPTYYVAGAAAQLTADTADKLVEYAELHLADLRRTVPAATWDDLVDDRSAVLNHFVTELPREEPNPGLLDEIILRGRASLQLSADSVQALLGREKAPDDPADQ